MKVTTHFNKIKSSSPTAIAIGSFDGVHLGHTSIINKLINISQINGLIPYVMFFEPLPKEFFAKGESPARISDLRNKLLELHAKGINNIICQKFNKKFADLDAKEFVVEYLVKKLNVKHIIVGDDFRFGYKRRGDFELLNKLSLEYDFKVDRVSTLNLDNQRISSSIVREALASNDIDKVTELLGRPIKINSRVIHGQKNGRKIGFHTANQKLPKNTAIKGVFLTRVHIGDESYFGITNAGNRPTIDGKKNLLETHIFDFDKDIYGQHITVELLKFIRSEIKFNSFDELKTQITNDIVQAKRLISTL